MEKGRNAEGKGAGERCFRLSGRRKKKNFGKAGWERAAGVKKNEESAARGFFFEEGLGKAGWEGKQKQRKTEGETKRRDTFCAGSGNRCGSRG